jgi:stress-induced morphogen
MAMTAEQIRIYILDTFPDAEIEIQDLAGDGDHYAVQIKSKVFYGKSRVEQHKMVYDALKGHMGSTLHAMQLKTITKE